MPYPYTLPDPDEPSLEPTKQMVEELENSEFLDSLDEEVEGTSEPELSGGDKEFLKSLDKQTNVNMSDITDVAFREYDKTMQEHANEYGGPVQTFTRESFPELDESAIMDWHKKARQRERKEKLTSADIDLAFEAYSKKIQPGSKMFTRESFGKSGQAKKWVPFVKKSRSHFEKLAESRRRGASRVADDIAYANAVYFGEGDPDEIYKRLQRSEALDKLDPIKGSFLAETQYGAVNMVGGMVEASKHAVPEMTAGMLVAAGVGQAGPQVVLPEEAVTVPAGLAAGWKVGTTKAWALQGAGATLYELRKKGVTGNAAKAISGLAAVPYALIEQAQWAQLAPGARTALKNVIQRSTMKVMTKAAKQYAGTYSQEVLEEILQELVLISAEDIATYASGKDVPLTRKYLRQRARRLSGTLKGTAKSMLWLPLGGTVTDVAVGGKQSNQKQLKDASAQLQTAYGLSEGEADVQIEQLRKGKTTLGDIDKQSNKSLEKKKETVGKAAIKLSDGTILEGNSHPQILIQATREDKNIPLDTSEMGFVTSEGRFVGRDEAAKMAGLAPDKIGESFRIQEEQKKKKKPFKAKVYRGRSAQGPVDAGVLGKGTYYSTKRETAEGYGEVKESEIELENPFYAESEEEVTKIAEDVAIEQDKKNADKPIDVRTELREEAVSNAIRERLEAKGYDGIVLDRGKAGKEVVIFGGQREAKAEGEPKTGKPFTTKAYHGTAQEIEEFKESKTFQGGFYFTDSEKGASDFAAFREYTAYTPEEKGNIVTAQISFENPLVVDAKGDFVTNIEDDAIAEAHEKGHDGVIIKNAKIDTGVRFTEEGEIDATAYEKVLPKDYPSRGKQTVYIAFSPDQIRKTQPTSEKAKAEAVEKEDTRGKERAEKRRSNFAKMKAHVLAKRLGFRSKHRRRINRKLTGKPSMKDMTLEEAEKVSTYFEQAAKEAGEAFSTAEEIAVNIEVATEEERADVRGLDKKGLQAFKEKIKKFASTATTSLARVERLTEYLDGKVKGLLYTNLWDPVTSSVSQAVETSYNRVEEFFKEVERITEDKKTGLLDKLARKQGVRKLATDKRTTVVEATDEHKAVKLSPTEKVAVYMFAQNEDGLRHLAEGNFSEFNNPQEIIKEVTESLTKEEKKIAEWMLDDMDKQFDRVQQAARIALGRELTKQDNYFALYLRDMELEKQTDFLSSLEHKLTPNITGESAKTGEVEERTEGARQPLKLDAFANYIYHVNRIEHFVNMAPVAASVGDIINNKKIRKAINDKTNGVGMAVYDRWLRDAVRGVPTENQRPLSKFLMVMRRNAIVYAIGYSLPSALRQQLSGFNVMAVHPTVANNYMHNAIIGKKPANYKKLEDFAYKNSVKLRARNFDRIEYIISKQSKARQKMLRKKPWSSKSLAFIRFMDKHTTVYAWTAAYDAAVNSPAVQKQFGLNGSHDAAVDFADKWVSRTQPMGSVEHLPDFYRGGSIERILSAFQNQVNNNLNFWVHDIYGAKKAGRIGNKMVAWRVLTSYVLPAMAFGAIGRGGLPKSWKDILFDLTVYPLGSLFLVGRMIYNGMLGFAGSGGVTSIGPSEVSKTISSAVEKDSTGVVGHGARAVGSLTGYIPSQFIRTGEGAIDLATGDTKDFRRLIYGEWSLEKYGFGESDEKSTGTVGGKKYF